MARSLLRPLLIAGCGLFAITGLTACDNYVSTQDLKVGDCFQADDSILLGAQVAAQITKVSCTEKHNSEVISTRQLEYKTYPGAAVLAKDATALCKADFKDYTGTDFADSDWDIYPLTPTETSWKKGQERSLTCIALTLPSRQGSIKK